MSAALVAVSAGTVLGVTGVVYVVGRRRPAALTRRRLPVVRGVAAAAAVGAALAPGQATGLRPFDVLLRMLLAVGVTLVAARARRWSWLVASAAVAIAASGSWWAVLGCAALGTAAGGALVGRRGRVMGALVGAAVVEVALRLPTGSHTGVPSAVAGASFAVLVVSGLRRTRHVRRILMFGGLVVAAVLAAALGAAYAVQEARPAALAGLASAQSAVTAGEHGDTAAATSDLETADADMASAHRAVAEWWAQPARLVPGLAQNLAAVRSLTQIGQQVMRPAVALARAADLHDLVGGGQVNLAALGRLAAPIDAGAASLRSALPEIPGLRSPWLVSAISDRLGTLAAQAGALAGQEDRLAAAISDLPALLGRNGPRTYLLIVQDTSELRGSGGLITDWGVVTASGGRLHLSQLNYIGDRPGAAPASGQPVYRVTGPYAAWAGRESFHPEWWPQDATFAPDFPTVARGLEQLFPQLGAPPVDGVISVDPAALADILRVTGPVRVAGWPVPISASNASAVFLHDQYVAFNGQNAARHAFNIAAGRAIFDRLTSLQLSQPGGLVEALAPAVADRDLLLYANSAPDEDLFRSMGATGAMSPTDQDSVEVVTQNGSESKVDYYLRRSESYSVDYNPGTGAVAATLTVRLHNTAPATGQPSYVIGGPDQYATDGTSRLYVSVYSPLLFSGATVDGRALPVSPDREAGRNVYTQFVVVPAGQTATVVYHLTGAVAPGPDYRVEIGRQATVAPDSVSVSVRAPGWRPAGPSGEQVTTAAPVSFSTSFSR